MIKTKNLSSTTTIHRDWNFSNSKQQIDWGSTLRSRDYNRTILITTITMVNIDNKNTNIFILPIYKALKHLSCF